MATCDRCGTEVSWQDVNGFLFYLKADVEPTGGSRFFCNGIAEKANRHVRNGETERRHDGRFEVSYR